MLLTFADGQKPQVLAGLQEAKIPYKEYFKFNNSALFVSNKGGMELDEYGTEDNFDEIFWKMGMKNFKTFMAELGKLQTKSLVLTKDVLKERRRLEVTIENIQKNIKMGLNKLEQLRVEHRTLDHHQSEMDKNKNFRYTVNEQITETRRANPGEYTTNCITCHSTCHTGYVYADPSACPVMSNGYCTGCYCHRSVHRNQPYVYVTRVQRVTKIAEDLKERYEVALSKKLRAEQIVQKCQEEFDVFQYRVLSMVEQARMSIERLSQIALRPNPLASVDYIDILIASEKAEARPGWKMRVDELVVVKKKAEQMQEIVQQDYDPFALLKKQYDEERAERQRMRWMNTRRKKTCLIS